MKNPAEQEFPVAVRQRLLRGLGATSLGPVVTALIQVVSVPVFLHFWGARLYGEWLILSALPAYLALSDLGFGNAAGNDMNVRAAAGDRQGALTTFQSTWTLVTLLSVACGMVVLSAVLAFPVPRWLNITLLSSGDVCTILCLLVLYALVALQGSIILAGFRCDGHFATGILLVNLFRILEASAATAAVFWGAKPMHVAALNLSVRLLATLVPAIIMLSMTPWVRYGFAHTTRERIKALWRPACAFMAFPAGNALSIQGMVLVVGVILGPVAVAAFSTMRTLTRFLAQMTDSIKNSVWPELSAAFGTQNSALVRKLHRYACQAAVAVSLLGLLFLLVLGAPIFSLWTHGRVTMDSTTFGLLLLVVTANSFWNTSSAVVLATNRHVRLALVYLGATSASLVLAALLTPKLLLPGASMSLFTVELATGWFVLRESLRLSQDSLPDFLRDLARVPKFP